MIGLNYLRLIFGEAPDRDFVRRVLETIIYPLVTAPPRQPTAQQHPGRTPPTSE